MEKDKKLMESSWWKRLTEGGVFKYYIIKYLSTIVFKGTIVIYGEGNGTPLQYSCLETPMDGGAW